MQSTRRQFLKALTDVGLGAAGCGVRALPGPGVDDGSRAAVGPEAVLSGLIALVLPFEHPDFPALSPSDVERRFEARLAQDPEAEAALRVALMGFDTIPRFSDVSSALDEAESASIQAFEALDAERLAERLGDLRAREAGLHDAFTIRHGRLQRFVGASAAAQADYLHMWGQSAYLLKRRFYVGTRALVLTSAYSMSPLWDAMGYDGPLLERPS